MRLADSGKIPRSARARNGALSHCWGVSGLEPLLGGKRHFRFPSKVKAVTHTTHPFRALALRGDSGSASPATGRLRRRLHRPHLRGFGSDTPPPPPPAARLGQRQAESRQGRLPSGREPGGASQAEGGAAPPLRPPERSRRWGASRGSAAAVACLGPERGARLDGGGLRVPPGGRAGFGAAAALGPLRDGLPGRAGPASGAPPGAAGDAGRGRVAPGIAAGSVVGRGTSRRRGRALAAGGGGAASGGPRAGAAPPEPADPAGRGAAASPEPPGAGPSPGRGPWPQRAGVDAAAEGGGGPSEGQDPRPGPRDPAQGPGHGGAAGAAQPLHDREREPAPEGGRAAGPAQERPGEEGGGGGPLGSGEAWQGGLARQDQHPHGTGGGGCRRGCRPPQTPP